MANEPTTPEKLEVKPAKEKPKAPPITAQLQGMLEKLKPLLKHHYFVVIFLILCGLVFAVFEVNNTLGAVQDETYKQQKEAQSLQAKFDEATISKIEALQKSTDSGSSVPTTSTGLRTNPFAE